MTGIACGHGINANNSSPAIAFKGRTVTAGKSVMLIVRSSSQSIPGHLIGICDIWSRRLPGSPARSGIPIVRQEWHQYNRSGNE